MSRTQFRTHRDLNPAVVKLAFEGNRQLLDHDILWLVIEVLSDYFFRLVGSQNLLFQFSKHTLFWDILDHEDHDQMAALFVYSVDCLWDVLFLYYNLVLDLETSFIHFDGLVGPSLQRRVILQRFEVIEFHFSEGEGSWVRPGEFEAVLLVKFDAPGFEVSFFCFEAGVEGEIDPVFDFLFFQYWQIPGKNYLLHLLLRVAVPQVAERALEHLLLLFASPVAVYVAHLPASVALLSPFLFLQVSGGLRADTLGERTERLAPNVFDDLLVGALLARHGVVRFSIIRI